MRPLVDREQELERLLKQRDSAPSLVVMRGRRRVGKTFLLAHAFNGENVVSYQADEQPRSVQLAAFAAEAARLLPGTPPLSFDSWDAAFELLDAQARERPIVVVIDEFQYARVGAGVAVDRATALGPLGRSRNSDMPRPVGQRADVHGGPALA